MATYIKNCDANCEEGGSPCEEYSCDGEFEGAHTITITLDWEHNPSDHEDLFPDIDLYCRLVGFEDGADQVSWYDNKTAAYLTLNDDAHPFCDRTPVAPEIISGGTVSYTKENCTAEYVIWRDQWSDTCSAETSPTRFDVKIRNDESTADIEANFSDEGWITIAPTNDYTWDCEAYAGYGTYGSHDQTSVGDTLKVRRKS